MDRNTATKKETHDSSISAKKGRPVRELLSAYDKSTAIINACADAKGKDITVLDVAEVFNLSDHFIIVSGRSDRQVQGISNKILETLEKLGTKPLSVEGHDEAHWILLDYDDVIVHVFYEPVREHYDLENLWMKARRLDLTTREGMIHLEAA